MSKRAFKRVYIKKHYLQQSGTVLAATAGGVSTKLNGNLLVPTPIISLLLFNTQISDLAGTILARLTDPSHTLEEQEINQTTIVYDSLDALADQVEFLANQANPGNVAVIEGDITFIGFQVKTPSARQEQIFEVIATAHQQATITYPIPDVNKRGNIFICAYTNTPADANSWSPPVMTIESKVTLTGLTADKRGYFKKAIIPAQGRNPIVNVNSAEINWDSDIISALIP
jgi:hypothetical protein